jgi:TPR repeat protein
MRLELGGSNPSAANKCTCLLPVASIISSQRSEKHRFRRVNPKAALVFRRKPPNLVIMDKLWFQKIFRRRKPETDEPNTRASADAGNADAQFRLGLNFANRQGQTRDYAQAAQWYLKAAGQNHALAQFNLGIMYAKGQGVRRDDAEAGMWFGKAAQLGDAGAQHNLGISHYRDSIRGLPKDAHESRIEAYKWFTLAAAQGYSGSDAASSRVVLKMTHEDVAEATQRVDAFRVSLAGHSHQ